MEKYTKISGIIIFIFVLLFTLITPMPSGSGGPPTSLYPVCNGAEVQNTCIGIATSGGSETVLDVVLVSIIYFLLIWGFFLLLTYLTDLVQKKYKERFNRPLNRQMALIIAFLMIMSIVGILISLYGILIYSYFKPYL